MSTDADMKINYALVLKQLRVELEGIEERRQALSASIAAMSRLVEDDVQEQPTAAERTFLTADLPAGDVRLPVIPPGHFKGKTTTEAYRDLMRKWPGHYSPPQVADLLVQGGIDATTRTGLIQGIHSVLKRERERAKRDGVLR